MPLWADALAEQPDRGYEDVFAEPDAPEPEETPPAQPRSAPIAIVAAAVVLAALAVAAVTRTSDVTIDEVPSAWSGVPMTCETIRLEEGANAVEVFRCRAVGSGVLPPGRYDSPESQWTSDLTRVDATVSRIVISPSGRLVGWAAY